MRTKFTRAGLCLLILNGLFYGDLISQIESNCFASRSYQMVKNVRYAISGETSVDDVADYDLLLARGYDNVLDVFQCLDVSGSLSTTTDYQNPAHNPDSWQPQIYRSIMDDHGVRFFNQEGSLIYQSSEDMYQALETEEMEISEAENFGKRDRIPEFNLDEFNFMEGELILKGNGIFTIIEEDSELTFDPSKQTIFTRYFQDGELAYLSEQYFVEADSGKIILRYEIIRTYQALVNGGWMEKSEYRTYNNYAINGNVVDVVNDVLGLHAVSAHQPLQQLGSFDKSVLEMEKRLKMFPNPTSDLLRIACPEGVQGIRVINPLGAVVAVFPVAGADVEIQVDHLPKGMYLLEVCTPSGQIFKQFVKN